MAGLYRRGKTYWGRAQRQGREHRRSLQTANRATAEHRLRQWLGELEAVKWGDKPRRSWEEAEARFVHGHLTTLKPLAAKRYGVSLKNLATDMGGLTLDQIGTATLSDFEARRRTDGVSAGTIRRDLACLSSMLTSAVDWEWIDANPVPAYLRRRSRRGLKEAPGRVRYLTPAEEEGLLAKAGREGRAAMILAIDTGLRREELFSLQWHQVNEARGTITTTTNTKSGRARKVPLPIRSRTILGTLKKRPECPYVLVNPDTGDRYVQMNKGFKGAMRRAKITDLCWHDLRRTAGCRWLQRDGKSMAEVCGLLGHSSIKVTEDRYAFLDLEAVAESIGNTETKSRPKRRSAAQKPEHGKAD